MLHFALHQFELSCHQVAAATNGVPVGYGGAAPAATRHAVEAPPPPEMQVPNKTLFVQVDCLLLLLLLALFNSVVLTRTSLMNHRSSRLMQYSARCGCGTAVAFDLSGCTVHWLSASAHGSWSHGHLFC